WTAVNPFTDITGHWAYNDIVWAYGIGIVNGVTTTTFSPDTAMNRGMMVTMLYRLAGSPAVTATNPFTDVAAGQYYTTPVIWAAANGIVKGTSATTFSPDTNITREQLASVLYRYAQFKGYDVSAVGDLSVFKDQASVSSDALTAMKWAVGAKLIQGQGGGILNPKGSATRAQIVTVLHRFVDYTA
ncbi:MAG: S-layer homology domain-containing protein, partial [Firmicutes bacterium]|nr:S-layer homology domain-containing protein [Bacillota bacterium]